MSALDDSGDLAHRLAATRVLVVGDVMLDCYTWGEVRRISPEAPVPVVKVNARTFRLGGAGNVAANLAGLGCRTALIGLAGPDAAADQLRGLLASQRIEDLLVVDAAKPTTTKTRIMAGKQQVVRLDEEDHGAVGRAITASVLATVRQRIPQVSAVILSDYGKGLFGDAEFMQALIDACNRHHVPVFIDPKDRHWERYAGATCITPNTAELEWAAGSPAAADGDLVPIARDVRRRLGLTWLLVTRGPRGMALFGQDPEPVMIAAQARDVFDVSGAGDTVIATLAAGVGAGLSFAEAATVANTAAGIVVGKLGTERIQWSELAPALADASRQRPASTLWKVADVQEALSRLARWRQADQRVVFTNGCFDLLHPGHVSLLHQARQLGDRLIIGLNTDRSIRRLKGDQRPILPGRDRAAILSALEDVDMVVFFDDDTPLTLIDRLKPDILVKGADYRIEEVVGRELVEGYGGRVRLVEILQGYSTSALARRLAAGDPHANPIP